MQQRSVLYLMGPGRMLERVRQVPGLVARLPRNVWDVVVRGKSPDFSLAPAAPTDGPAELPDFAAILSSNGPSCSAASTIICVPIRQRRACWPATAAGYQAARFDGALAAQIAQEELADLRDWLQKRWHATPRDTAALTVLAAAAPRPGKNWSIGPNPAPYLLVLIIVATHHALFGGLDLAVLGSWSLAAWIMEKLSNEVAVRHARDQSENRPAIRRPVHRQIENIAQWLQRQTPAAELLDSLERRSHELSDFLGVFV